MRFVSIKRQPPQRPFSFRGRGRGRGGGRRGRRGGRGGRRRSVFLSAEHERRTAAPPMTPPPSVDPDYDPFAEGDAPRRSARRSLGVARGKYSRMDRSQTDDEETNGVDDAGDDESVRMGRRMNVEERWLSEDAVHMWEIRVFMDRYVCLS